MKFDNKQDWKRVEFRTPHISFERSVVYFRASGARGTRKYTTNRSIDTYLKLSCYVHDVISFREFEKVNSYEEYYVLFSSRDLPISRSCADLELLWVTETISTILSAIK